MNMQCRKMHCKLKSRVCGSKDREDLRDDTQIVLKTCNSNTNRIPDRIKDINQKVETLECENNKLLKMMEKNCIENGIAAYIGLKDSTSLFESGSKMHALKIEELGYDDAKIKIKKLNELKMKEIEISKSI